MSITSIDQLKKRDRRQSLFNQFLDLFLIELSNWRWGWTTILLRGTITPLFTLVALNVFAQDSSKETVVYILTGNIVIGLLMGSMNAVQSHVTFLRFDGAMDYFATLPIRRYIFILSMSLAFILFSLPSLLITILLGPVLVGVSLAIHPLLILVAPLCTASLAGVGALLGLVGRTRSESLNLGFLVTLAMSALGPVVVPPDRLPSWILTVGRFVPTTYAASAIRQTLVGPLTERIFIDIVVLLVVLIAFLWLVTQKIAWRQDVE